MSLRIQAKQPTVVNLLSSPEDLTTGLWYSPNLTTVSNIELAPDGTMTATKFAYSTPGAFVSQDSIASMTSGETYTISVYAKVAGPALLYGYNGIGIICSGGTAFANYGLDGNGYMFPGRQGVMNMSIEPAAHGFYRIAYTFVAGSSHDISFWLSGYNGLDWTGNTMTLWGAQLTAEADPLLNSNDFTNWGMTPSPNGYSVTPNATTAPDGTQTASFILKPTTYGSAGVYYPFSGGKLGGRYHGSIYLKPGGYTKAFVNFENSAFDNFQRGIYVDLINGNIYNTLNNATGFTTSVIILDDEWYRVDVFATAGTTYNYNYVFSFAPLDDNWQLAFNGNGTSGIYAWTGRVAEDTGLLPYYPQSQLNSGFRIQSTQLSPSPVSSALLYLDGNDPAIQGQGVWNDLSGHSGYAVFLGPVTYSSNDGGSLVFNGTSTYASLGNSNDMNFGLGDFTINFWMNPATWGDDTSRGIIEKKAHDGTAGWTIYNDSGAPNKINARLGYQNNFLSTSNVVTNQWQNWTLVRNGTNIYWYLNGTLDASGTNTENLFDNNAGTLIGHTTTWDGYFDGRLSTIAVYTHALTASQILQEFETSKTRYGFAPTSGFRIRESAPMLGSLSFNGTTQKLTLPVSDDWNLGLGDFTIEWWQYLNDSLVSAVVFSIESPEVDFQEALSVWYTKHDARIAMYVESGGGGIGDYPTDNGLVFNTWVHFAVVRKNQTVYVYQNGILAFTAGLEGTDFGGTNCKLIVGGNTMTSGLDHGQFPGKITNFRLIKGTAIYTASFTPPAAPLEAVANTKLLLLAEQRTPLRDSSGLNKQVTNVGNAPWDSSSPF